LAKDKLFLLASGFEDPALDDGGKGWICAACAMVEGYLGYFPQLREQIDVAYLPFKRPRQPIIELIGETRQGMPVLILAEPSAADGVETLNGQTFIADEKAILRYLAAQYGVSAPHP